jgi:hypothetical protein
MEEERRTWHYILPPIVYDMRCDKCWDGELNSKTGKNITWSEFAHKIWCYDCKIDTEGFDGVFGGPIPMHASYLMGLCFDRWNLETNEIEFYNLETNVWDTVDVAAKNFLDGKDFYGNDLLKEGQKYFQCATYQMTEMMRNVALEAHATKK